jgi:hypothetical protein
MERTRANGPLLLGLFLVALTWFLFTGYEFLKSAFNIGRFTYWISLTDTAGDFGLGFRTMAALIAVFTIVFYLAKKNLSKAELFMSVRWVLLGEAICFLSLTPCIAWYISIGLNLHMSMAGIGSLIEGGLPVWVESIAIPIVLAKLFFELSPTKPARGILKWGLIAGTVYVFVFWLDNTCNWLSTINNKGIEYVTSYPDHILSFGLTTIGLLAIALYSAYFTKKTIGAQSFSEVDWRKVGGIVTAVGLYFLVIYVMWLFLGTDAKWSDWYAWFLGHNMELWAVSLPLVGLPLLFTGKKKEQRGSGASIQP